AAARVATLWWGMLAVATVVFALVVALLLFGLLRPRRGGEPPGGSRGFVLGGTVVTIAILLGLLAFALPTMVALSAPAPELAVEVTGRQWWWEVRYPEPGFATANELHIPLGQTVRVTVTAADVI